MDEEIQEVEPQKMTSTGRDRWQSMVLVWVAAPLLGVGAVWPPLQGLIHGTGLRPWGVPLLLSAGFAVLVWLLRAATAGAAAIGFIICLVIAEPRQSGAGINVSALLALLTLFVATFLSTRFGRTKKEAKRLAERRSGRRASQIVANLGMAGLCAAVGWHAGCLAALAEATADTVSSEIGQAVGGQPWMITTMKRVPAGTDGGVSLIGTAAGVAAAALVVAAGEIHRMMWAEALLVFVAACAGLIFDSLMGATVERRGWLGNDLVNFSSTLFAALVAWILMRGTVAF